MPVRLIVLLFIIVQLVDINLLIILGRYIGFWYTISITIVISILGIIIVQREGLNIIKMIKENWQKRNIPAAQLWNGLFIIAGGIFLIAPGIITDIVGLFCLIPWTRAFLKNIMTAYISKHFVGGWFKRR